MASGLLSGCISYYPLTSCILHPCWTTSDSQFITASCMLFSPPDHLSAFFKVNSFTSSFEIQLLPTAAESLPCNHLQPQLLVSPPRACHVFCLFVHNMTGVSLRLSLWKTTSNMVMFSLTIVSWKRVGVQYHMYALRTCLKNELSGHSLLPQIPESLSTVWLLSDGSCVWGAPWVIKFYRYIFLNAGSETWF